MFVLFSGLAKIEAFLEFFDMEWGHTINPIPGRKTTPLMKGYSLSFLQEDIHSNKQVVDFLESSTIILVGYLELARKRPRKDI